MAAKRLNQSEAAGWLGVTVTQLKNLGSKGAPREADGRYDWLPLLRWYIGQKQAEAVRTGRPKETREATAAKSRRIVAGCGIRR
jgi:hypothetical protein